MTDIESSSDTTASRTTNSIETMLLDPHTIKMELQDENHINHNTLFKQRNHLSDSMVELDAMKTTIQDRGSQLSNVWNDLYNLLGDYQAKLFSKEGEFQAAKAKYESISDMDQLRNDLISKDNEVKELRDRLIQIESRSETVQLDLSVKNSLLKKYQSDLLEKEASLLLLQSQNKKLENRVQVLENKIINRATANHENSLQRTPNDARALSIAHSVQRTPTITSNPLLRQTPPSLKRRGLPSSSIMHMNSKRRSLPTAAQAKAPVLVEVEEDEADEINLSLEDAQGMNTSNDTVETGGVNAPLYMDAWPEEPDTDNSVNETDATQLGSLPGENYQGQGQFVENIDDQLEDQPGDIQWQMEGVGQDGSHDSGMFVLDGTTQKDMAMLVYSAPIQHALDSGNITGVFWHRLITETAIFMLRCNRQFTSADYRALGQHVYSLYPCIGRDGHPPWRPFTKATSQRVRHLRLEKKQNKVRRRRFAMGVDMGSLLDMNLPLLHSGHEDVQIAALKPAEPFNIEPEQDTETATVIDSDMTVMNKPAEDSK